MQTGGQVLVAALEAQGVERIFCVPGESFLAVLDALHDSAISITVARQEGGAAMMAEATAKMTGRPGVCFVTRGPGATNAASGVHVAQQDSTPLILFIGQVERGVRGRDAFQEVDYRQMYGSIAKWVAEIDSAHRIPELVSRAFYTAVSGRPGPVVLSLPEDMLVEMTDASPAPSAEAPLPVPDPRTIARVADALRETRSPVVIAGGSCWTADAVGDLQRFAERWRLPVAVTFRRQELFNHEHPNYAGDVGRSLEPSLKSYIADSDLILLIGDRFSETPSQGYELLSIPVPRQRLVHVYPDASELGRVYSPWAAVLATPATFLKACEAYEPNASRSAPDNAPRLHAASRSWSTPTGSPGPLNMAKVVKEVERLVPRDAIITNGAGNFATWVHRFYTFRGFGTQLGAVSGSMGYGLPAAVAAKLQNPSRTVVCFAGDGDFQMTMQEMGTAMAASLAIIVIVVDNGMYGTIRMHQEREYPGRVSGSDLPNPDFVAIAKAYGAYSEFVETTEAFAPAFHRCLDSGRLSLLHLKLDPEAIAPSQTLSALRAGALARR